MLPALAVSPQSSMLDPMAFKSGSTCGALTKHEQAPKQIHALRLQIGRTYRRKVILQYTLWNHMQTEAEARLAQSDMRSRATGHL